MRAPIVLLLAGPDRDLRVSARSVYYAGALAVVTPVVPSVAVTPEFDHWRYALSGLTRRMDAVFIEADGFADQNGSRGAVCDVAREHKVPVFTDIGDLREWVRSWYRRPAAAAWRLDADEGATVSSEPFRGVLANVGSAQSSEDAAHLGRARREQLLDHARDVAADFRD